MSSILQELLGMDERMIAGLKKVKALKEDFFATLKSLLAITIFAVCSYRC
jgi:hypothetical protein